MRFTFDCCPNGCSVSGWSWVSLRSTQPTAPALSTAGGRCYRILMKTSDEKEYEHAVIAACSAFLLTYLKPSDMIHISVTGRCQSNHRSFTKLDAVKATGVILAGGDSRRMGRNKALMRLGDESLISRTLKRLQSVTDETIVIANSAHLYSELECTGVRGSYSQSPVRSEVSTRGLPTRSTTPLCASPVICRS